MHKRKLEVNFYNHVNKIIFKSGLISGVLLKVCLFCLMLCARFNSIARILFLTSAVQNERTFKKTSNKSTFGYASY